MIGKEGYEGPLTVESVKGEESEGEITVNELFVPDPSFAPSYPGLCGDGYMGRSLQVGPLGRMTSFVCLVCAAAGQPVEGRVTVTIALLYTV